MPTAIADILIALKKGHALSREQSRDIFEQIMTGQVSDEQLGEFLSALATKGETVDEIAGAADILNEKVTRVHCRIESVVDTCGTGGDGVSTFNTSTAAAIIAAAAGATVAKHGNRTHTRVSGSAEAIGALGVNLDAPVAVLEKCLDECGIAFLYAPNLHPAMRYAAPVRKRLAIRTIFNLLGPLTNPAGAKHQLLGVSKPELVDTLAQVLAARGVKHAWVVHGHDGLCDLSITGPSRVTQVQHGRLQSFTINPEDVGLHRASLSSLLVDSPQASAAAISRILTGELGPMRDHALLNAGAALVVAGLAKDLQEGVKRAIQAIDSGTAHDKLAQLVATSKG